MMVSTLKILGLVVSLFHGECAGVECSGGASEGNLGPACAGRHAAQARIKRAEAMMACRLIMIPEV
jgi:hypothetical protein